MRASTILASLFLVVSFSFLVAASHACWTDRGSAGAEQPVEFAVAGGGAYVITVAGANAQVYKYSGAWNSYATVTGFTPQAVGTDGSDVFVSGTVSAGCAGLIPCARVKKVTAGAVSGQTFKVQEYGADVGQHDALNFKRFVKAGSNVFLTATNGVVFQKGGTCGSDWCGRKITDGSEITGATAFGSFMLIGTASGKVYPVGFRADGGPVVVNPEGTVSAGTSVVGIGGDTTLYTYYVALLSNGKAYASYDGLQTWRQIGTDSLVSSSMKDLVSISNPMNRGSALYTVGGGTTYAFTNFSTSAETYTTGTPTGDVRLIQDGATIWALGLGSRNLLSFNCGASPTIPYAGDDATVPFGGNFIRDGTSSDGSSPGGHIQIFDWQLTSPVGVTPEEVFQTFSISQKHIEGTNAIRSGSYVWNLAAYYIGGFPQLRIANNVGVVVLEAPVDISPSCTSDEDCAADAAHPVCDLAIRKCVASVGPALDLCSGVTCLAGQHCDAASGSCVASETPGPGQTGQNLSTVAVGGRCSSSSQCTADAECRAGTCLQLVCAEGRALVAHSCVTICSESSDCSASEACIEGVCRQLNCPANKPIILDNQCSVGTAAITCGNVQHNKRNGICCNNQWLAGQTSCPNAAGNLPWFIAFILLIVIIAMAVAMYFLVVKKPKR